MKTSEEQSGEKRQCRECGMSLQSGQEACPFCGEANPLPEKAEKEKVEQPVDMKPPETSPDPAKPLHQPAAVPKPAATVQQRDPICPHCGKDNSKIANARFCFTCGTTLLTRQVTVDSAPPMAVVEKCKEGSSVTKRVPDSSTVAAGQQRDPICPRCGKDNSKIANARFCFACGTTLLALQSAAETAPRPVPRSCPHCGRDLTMQSRESRFCIYCGKNVAAQSSTIAPVRGPGDEHVQAAAPPQQQLPLHAEQATAQARGGEPAAAHERPPAIEAAQASRLLQEKAIARPAKPAPEPVDMVNITCRYEAPVLSATFSKDGAEFLVGTAKNECIARQTTNARARRTVQGDRTGRAITVLVERDGRGFAACMNGTVMRFTRVVVLDPKSGSITGQVKTSQAAILSVAVNPAGSQLILGGYDKNAEIYDLKTGNLAFTLTGHAGAIDAVAFDPTGKLAATGGRDGAVKVWKAENGELIRSFFGHTKPVLSLAFSQDCTRLASGSEDGSIKIWDPELNSAVSTLTEHRGGVLALAFNNDGKLLISGGQDTVARVWDLEATKVLRTVDVHAGAITAVAISPDGKRVVTGGADKRTYHWFLVSDKK